MTLTPQAAAAVSWEICEKCGHMKSGLKAKREGGKIVRTCACLCHPPTESITPEMLRTSGWHEPPAAGTMTDGWD
jgi:hypothetical protein